MIWLVRARYRAARLERATELAAEHEALGGGVKHG
jgi:hypothetical protein